MIANIAVLKKKLIQMNLAKRSSVFIIFFQSDKDICSLLVWNNIQTAPCVVFQDGSSMSLTEIASTSKTETGKRRKTTKVST